MATLDYAYPDYEVQPGALGKPLIGTKVLVVDEEGALLPIGQVGRLCVERGGRLNFTGDLGREDGAGYLWHCGRSDDVIISARYTIGATEIEVALLRTGRHRVALLHGHSRQRPASGCSQPREI